MAVMPRAATCLALLLAACSEPPGDTPTGPAPAAVALPAPPSRPSPTVFDLLGGRPAPAAPVQAPPVPYSVLGKWTAAGRTVVYLKRGEQSITVDAPGPLDAQYAVQAIDEHRLTLKYLPLGVLQQLDLDAPAARSAPAQARPAVAAAAAPAAPAADSEMPDN